MFELQVPSERDTLAMKCGRRLFADRRKISPLQHMSTLVTASRCFPAAEDVRSFSFRRHPCRHVFVLPSPEFNIGFPSPMLILLLFALFE